MLCWMLVSKRNHAKVCSSGRTAFNSLQISRSSLTTAISYPFVYISTAIFASYILLVKCHTVTAIVNTARCLRTLSPPECRSLSTTP